jgi:O-antigen ligase
MSNIGAVINRLPAVLLHALALMGALCLSVFFQGFEVALFSAAQSVLVLWALAVLWRVYADGILIPLSTTSLTLTLFWLWLGVTLIWTPVVYVSVFDFWWIGTLPLMFWLCTLEPNRQQFWRPAAAAILALGLGLALYATFQLFILQQAPRSTFININSHAALLNLIALPLVGYFVARQWQARSLDKFSVALLTGFFVLIFAVALTQGRGPALSFALGLAVVFSVAFRHVRIQALLTIVAVTAIAFAVANVTWQGGLAGRYVELSDPVSARSIHVRLLIWQAAWEMIKTAPWLGIGLGTFSLAYPPFRDSADSSAGFLVHNDYLQLWVEAGLPALLLLLAVLVSTLWMFLRLLRSQAAAATRIEAAGLFAGLFAVAVHSLVDFNFHVLPILIIGGAMLARLHALAGPVLEIRQFHWQPSRLVARPVYRLITALLLLFPMLYYVSITTAVFEAERGIKLAAEGKLDKADATFAFAYRVYPYADNALLSHADLYRHVLTLTPKTALNGRQEVFRRAEEFLDRAARLNPLRPLNFVVRGQLYRENPDLAGPDWKQKVEAAYQHALELNPRFYRARYVYAKFLQDSGREDRARNVLEAGIREYYASHEDLVPYLSFTAKLRRVAGDEAGARELGHRIEAALQASGWEWVPLPERQKPLGAVTN